MDVHETAPARKRQTPYDPQSEIVRACHWPKVTGLSDTTIWRHRQAGRWVPVLRLGDNSLGARRADLVRWLAARETR